MVRIYWPDKFQSVIRIGTYYIGEQDYYLPRDDSGQFKRYDSPAASLVDDLEAMKTLVPSHILFNGVTGALQGDGKLLANVGENVLIVHSQANRQSYPHLIGGARRLRLGTRRFQ